VGRILLRETTLPPRVWFSLAAVVLTLLTNSCVQSSAESRPIRPGSARDPAGASASSSAASSSEPAPVVSLADLNWGWSRAEDGFELNGESAYLISYERDNATSRSRTGLHRVLIAQETVNQPIPPLAVEANLIGFQEAFMGAVRGTIDQRTMVYVNGPSIGRRSKWTSIEYTAADGVPTKLYSVVFLESRSLAVVATMATQGSARLQDTASLAQDVADRLSGRDTLELPAMRTFGT
jgi:hypothetical protein